MVVVPRLLLPREHGAYAEVLLPLATGVALGSPGPASWLVVLAALLAFLAHEPLLILRGARGVRIRQRDRDAAVRGAVWLLAGALLAGAAAATLGSAETRRALLLPLVPAACYAMLLARRYAKTLARDLLASTAFSALVVPVGLAGGAAPIDALTGAVVWTGVFLIQTLLVRGLVAAGKQHSRRPLVPTAVTSAALLVAAIWIAVETPRPGGAALAVLPALVPAVALCVRPVPARRLKRVGWSLAAADLGVLAVLLLTLVRSR